MKRTQIQLADEQFEALRLLAFNERRSIADLVREAIEKLLAERAKAQASMTR